MPAPVQRPSGAQPVELVPPGGSSGSALVEDGDGYVDLGEDPRVQLPHAFGRQGPQIVEKGGDAAGATQQERHELRAASMLIAARTGRNDDPDVLAPAATGSGNYMFAGQGSIGSRGSSAVGALPSLY